MTPEVRDRDFGTRRATWIKVACAFIFTAALVVIPVSMPSTNGAFTAQVRNPTNSVTVAPVVTCAQVMAGEKDVDFAYHLNRNPPINLVNNMPVQKVDEGVFPSLSAGPCVNDGVGYMTFPGASTTTSASIVHKSSAASSASYSQEMWFRTTEDRTIDAGGGLMYAAGTTNYPVEVFVNRQLYLNNNGQLAMGSTTGLSGFEGIETTQRVSDRKWHHVISVRDSANKRLYLYLDGVQVVDASTSVTLDDMSPAYWRIGCARVYGSSRFKNASTNCFKGDIAFAAVYNRAFTQADVTRHYKAGTG